AMAMAARRALLRGVVFDLDGTLRVPPSLDLQALRGAILKDGHRSPEQVAKALQAIDSADMQRQEGCGSAIAGAKEVCDHIDASNLHRAIITLSSSDDAQRFQAEVNNRSPFSPVFGKEYSSLKPSAHPLMQVCRQWCVGPRQVLMVGDSPRYDIACGNAAGALTCLVDPLFRYNNIDRQLPMHHRPIFKVHSLFELKHLIQQLQIRRWDFHVGELAV
ncbi:hypothetical protein GOP47_0022229, partial [Adiantum capillus-veneris]